MHEVVCDDGFTTSPRFARLSFNFGDDGKTRVVRIFELFRSWKSAISEEMSSKAERGSEYDV